jgi:cellulose synthase/poly-beta-1,6-N-acetylglucosamine synthase-like glycosyltransferase
MWGRDRIEAAESARAAHAARFSLSEGAPELSARRRLTGAQGLVIIALVLGLAWALWRHPRALSTLVQEGALIAFSVLTLWRLFAAAASLAPADCTQTRWVGELPIYTILCPLYREAHMLPALLERLGRLDYPVDRLDLKLVLESDDVETVAAASAMVLPDHVELIVVPPGAPRTKPKALNYALTFAHGAFVTIYDAEDAPDPRQLRAALDAFAAGGEELGCVQAPLLIDNGRASWIAAQFATEYAIQFREALPWLARLRQPMMLGGTSNHFRTHALSGAGGWDPFNVTEDADIGYRLARDGWASGVIDAPTWEEAPVSFKPWLRQRARWLKGHMQTWLVLMRAPVHTARAMGWRGFLAMQLMLAGSILSAFAHGPIVALIVVAVLSPHVQLGWICWALALFGYCTAAYGAATAAADVRDHRLAVTAATMPFYWPLCTLAAVLALAEFVLRPHYWAKTEHGLSARDIPRQWTSA